MDEVTAAPKGGKFRAILDVVTAVVMIAAAVTVAWRSLAVPAAAPSAPARKEVPVPRVPLNLDGAAVKGNPAARVVMIEFSDFQCPFCARFAKDILPRLEASYVATGQMRLAFRHMPLPIHALAQKAAESAACAGLQGRFWEMHDLLFAKPTEMDEGSIKRRADMLGLARPRFDRCLSGETAAEVSADTESGKALGISGTPLFFIGTAEGMNQVRVQKIIAGAKPIGEFVQTIDALVALRARGDAR